ncbi:NAD(P)-dependent oxidoreductase [Streptomyces sp. NPDC097107]|uniref:NAD(P)-dependent oxidoreductase n=1 Tax=Streptomyces sp. NPDC097107 TaxID=3366089 RepID=UPI0037F1EAAB
MAPGPTEWARGGAAAAARRSGADGNAARGSLIDTEAPITHLTSGRIHAVLQVTDPEVLPAESPLYRLPTRS